MERDMVHTMTIPRDKYTHGVPTSLLWYHTMTRPTEHPME